MIDSHRYSESEVDRERGYVGNVCQLMEAVVRSFDPLFQFYNIPSGLLSFFVDEDLLLGFRAATFGLNEVRTWQG